MKYRDDDLCHCGLEMNQHTAWDNHAPVLKPEYAPGDEVDILVGAFKGRKAVVVSWNPSTWDVVRVRAQGWGDILVFRYDEIYPKRED